MAKKTDDVDDDEEEEGGGGGKKKIIFAVVGLAAVGGVYQFVLSSPPPEEAEGEMPEEVAAEEVPVVEGEIVQMEEMILNIDGESGYLRIGLALVLDEETLAADFEPEKAIAQDVAVQYLSSQSSDTLRSAEGREAAKEELSVLIREAYGDAKVVRVLFTSLVMQ